MADSPEEMFSLDAGVLLAKLHLAGISQTKQKAVVVNSGIVDSADSDTPEKPNKSNFNLDNKSGQYEVATFVPLEYVVPYEELGGEGYVSKVTSHQKIDSDKTKDIETKLQEQNEARKKDKEKAIEKAKKEAVDILKTYFENFIGKQNLGKIDTSNIVAIEYQEVKSAKDVEVKDFKISEADQKALEENANKAKAEFEKDAKSKTSDLAKSPYKTFLCCKVAYSVSIGK